MVADNASTNGSSTALEGEVIQPSEQPPQAPDVDADAKELGRVDRGGRPPEMTPDVVSKLIAAFNNGFNITEACQYAGISRTMYYDWLGKDDQFSYKMSEAQGAVNRRAKVIVAEAINAGDVNTAKWYLNARDPEFAAKLAPQSSQDVIETRERIKDFLDDDDSANDQRAEPTATDSAGTGIEVAQTPTDIS